MLEPCAALLSEPLKSLLRAAFELFFGLFSAAFWRYFSPSDDDDSRGDGLINRLIEACQMDDVRRAFAIYERLILLQVPLYEGVRPLETPLKGFQKA